MSAKCLVTRAMAQAHAAIRSITIPFSSMGNGIVGRYITAGTMAVVCSGIMADGAPTNGVGGARITLNGAIGVSIAVGTMAGAATATGMNGMRTAVMVGTGTMTKVNTADVVMKETATGAATVISKKNGDMKRGGEFGNGI